MTPGPTVDGVLVQWGERLFYPPNRIVKVPPTPRLDTLARRKAAVIRRRIEATVLRRAPQVMVKVTGGGRGMRAIAAHFRYISKGGRLDIEDDRGSVRRGREAVDDLAEQWRHAGAKIDDESPRREAFNLMLSMPQGTDARIVKAAAREFARAELRGHRYVMVLHEHQANPHVHLSVRAQGADGRRLNPRKADLHRWRETFADKLRGYGVEAEATRQATRGAHHRAHPIGRVKMREDGRLPGRDIAEPGGERFYSSRRDALEAWIHIAQALGSSGTAEDRRLARGVVGFLKDSKAFRRLLPRLEQLPDRQREQARAPTRTPPQPELTRTRPDIDWER
ncbi:MAG: conjugal transfer protein TraS [Rubrivivax sp.]